MDIGRNYYFFGTSYTAGGGLSYNRNDEEYNNLFKQAYSHLGTFLPQEEYAYPGYFKRLLDENGVSYGEVVNFAKEGFGLERIIREIYKLIKDPSFDRSNSTLFIELTNNLHRRDTWFNPINDHIISNHHVENGKPTKIYHAKTWYYDEKDDIEVLDKYDSLLKQYIELTFNQEEVLAKAESQTIGLLTLLDTLGITYYLTSSPFYVDKTLLKNIKYNPNREIFYNLEYQIAINKWSIADETHYMINDQHHAGVYANREIANIIYRRIIIE